MADPVAPASASTNGATSSGVEGHRIANAQPVTKAARRRRVSNTEIGTTGLRETGGFVYDEFLPQLSSSRRHLVWREMADNDPVIGGLLFAIEMLTRQVEWRVDPADGASVAEMVETRQRERAELAAVSAKAARESAAAAAAAQAMAGAAGAEGAPPPDDQVAKAASPGIQLAEAMRSIGIDTAPHQSALTRLDAAATRLSNARRVRLAKASADESHRAEVWSRALHDLTRIAHSGDPAAHIMLTRLAAVTKATAPADIFPGLARTKLPDPPTPEESALGPGNPPPGTTPAADRDPTPEDFFDKVAIEGEEDAVFIETCFHDMESSWEDTLAEILSMLTYGFAYHEIVYKIRGGRKDDPALDSRYDDGKVGWRKFAPRSQETTWRWELDRDGTINGMWQVDPYKANSNVLIPIDKALLFRTTVRRNNPEGRALDPATPVPTPNGWRTMADLEVGDPIFDETGKIRYVTATADWEDRPRYSITFSDGSTIVADAEHEWVTTKVWERSVGRDPVIRTTSAIADTRVNSNGVTNHATPWAAPVQYPEQDLLLDPWYLGLWLGDGTALSGDISCHAEDAAETLALIEQVGYTGKVVANGEAGLGRLVRVYGTRLGLRALDLKANKHIPVAYLRGSIPQRLALLSGLMDSDGTVDADGRCEFTNTNMNLIEGCAELVRSLGCGARISLRKRANGSTHKRDTWCVKFTPVDWIPFRLQRKRGRMKVVRSRQNHYFVDVTRIEDGPTRCIEVDSPSHLFLVGESFIPTHNSILRNAYRPWVFKRRIEEIEAIGIERDLAGFPVAYVPYRMMTSNATPEETAALNEIKDIVSNIKRDEQEGAVFPNAFDPESGNKLYELTLLSTGGSRQFDTDATVARYDQRIAMTVLADFILLGHEKIGSFSLGQVKADLFTSALEAWLDMISQVFNATAIPRLRKMNGEDPAASPTLTHGKLNQIDLGALGDFLVKVSQAGAPLFPDDNLEAYLRQVAGLPDKTNEMTDIE
jgi:hypothetical protein